MDPIKFKTMYSTLSLLSERQSSSHLRVRSTEVLFLLLETQAGTSSAKVTQKSGFIEETSSTYSAGFIWFIHESAELVIQILRAWNVTITLQRIKLKHLKRKKEVKGKWNNQKTASRSLERRSIFVSAVMFRKGNDGIPRYGREYVLVQTKHLVQSSNVRYCFRRNTL